MTNADYIMASICHPQARGWLNYWAYFATLPEPPPLTQMQELGLAFRQSGDWLTGEYSMMAEA